MRSGPPWTPASCFLHFTCTGLVTMGRRSQSPKPRIQELPQLSRKFLVFQSWPYPWFTYSDSLKTRRVTMYKTLQKILMCSLWQDPLKYVSSTLERTRARNCCLTSQSLWLSFVLYKNLVLKSCTLAKGKAKRARWRIVKIDGPMNMSCQWYRQEISSKREV